MADAPKKAHKQHIKVGPHQVRIPRSKMVRLALGGALIIGGILGFLPILGFWMIPLGLLVVAQDIPAARRFYVIGRRALILQIRTWRRHLRR